MGVRILRPNLRGAQARKSQQDNMPEAEPVATETTGGMPEKMSSGVSRKPPPTPNSPDKKPTAPPMPKMMNMFTDSSAMGR